MTTQTGAGPLLTISYNYDLLGNKTGMTTPSGKAIGYGYDILNRLQTVTHPDNAVTMFGYDKVGNRQSVLRATSATASPFSTTGYAYDNLNRLTDLVNKNGSSAVVSSYHYGLRLDGKRSSVTETGASTNNGTTLYTYDDAGKLTQEAGPYATIAYGYDNVGNRLLRTVTNAATGNGTTLVNGVTNTVFDNNDRITSQTGTCPTVTHTYDLDGNEKTVNGQAASYDFENHLVSLANPTNNTLLASYTYDADGNRVSTYTSSNTSNPTINYVIDTSLPYASVVEEYNGTTLAARYDYGNDLVRMDRGPVGFAVASYYIYDGLGSTRQLVSTAGTVTDSYGYSAFGEMASRTPATNGTVNPFLFNAQQFDGASGDYYLRARYYDQSNGRFISQDPFGGSDYDPVSLHRYLYAGIDPTNRVDPTGEDPEADTLAASGIGATLSATLNSVVFNAGALASRALIYVAGHAIEIEFYSSAGILGLTAATSFVHSAVGLVIANNEKLVPDHPNSPDVYGDALDRITKANSSNYQGLDDFRDGYATSNKLYANFQGGDFRTDVLDRIRKDATKLDGLKNFKPKTEPQYEGLPTYSVNSPDPNLQVRGKILFGAIPENYANLLEDQQFRTELKAIDQSLENTEVVLAPLRGFRK